MSLSGPGVLTIDHRPGLIVAAIEHGDVTPWVAPKAVATSLPKSLTLDGAAMALTLHAETPMLLRARTTAPVILSVRQSGAGDPEPMPLGADGLALSRAAGDAELRVFSPHDGPLSGTLDLSAEADHAGRRRPRRAEPVLVATGTRTGNERRVRVFRRTHAGHGRYRCSGRSRIASAVRLLDAIRRAAWHEGVVQIRTLQPGPVPPRGTRTGGRAGAYGASSACIGLTPRS